MILEDTAIAKLKDLIAEESNPNLKLRVFVQGGGACCLRNDRRCNSS